MVESERAAGVGRALMAACARVAVERGWRRLELAVLDWNPARAFYAGLGMRQSEEWLPYRHPRYAGAFSPTIGPARTRSDQPGVRVPGVDRPCSAGTRGDPESGARLARVSHDADADPTQQHASDEEAAVRAANAAFYAAFNARDIAGMETLWATDAVVTCVHPGWNVLRGRDAVLESWRAILDNPQQPKIVGAAEHATLLGDLAFVVGRELVGGDPLAVTNAFIREGSSWKLLHHHAGGVARP